LPIRSSDFGFGWLSPLRPTSDRDTRCRRTKRAVPSMPTRFRTAAASTRRPRTASLRPAASNFFACLTYNYDGFRHRFLGRHEFRVRRDCWWLVFLIGLCFVPFACVSIPVALGGIVIEPILERFPHEIILRLIKRLAGARSFRDAKALMSPLVPHFARFNDDEIGAFATAAMCIPRLPWVCW